MTLHHDVQTGSTRERLLNAACVIFANKGYRDTTVADICEVAQANIAAVNYHFGNKEKLYRQVWNSVLDRYAPVEIAQPDHATAAAEVQLYVYVVERLEWLIRGDPLERLIRFELTQPSGLVDDLRDAGLQKTRRPFLDVIQQIAGGDMSEDGLQLCCTSILSQCRALMTRSELDHRLEKDYRVPEAEIRCYARHVTTFSIAGIQALAAHEGSKKNREREGVPTL